ncbi:DUF1269 domain-containing protein [Tabrizicola thermarum]|uniref:DUF1269 domain-containing protein n=1 Tax=Tabrizicola thermarum TaxID=2670345 RepID=UPI000FFBFD81|nr:DUF1269 domain-containing protein [Tabrizicola thermarum]
MSDLILAFYRTPSAAFAAGQALAAFQRAAGTEAEDIVVVTRDGTGRVQVNQSIDMATGRPLGGGRWGALIGLLFLDERDPRSGPGGLAAQFRAVGLDEGFLQDATTALDKTGAVIGMRVRLLGRDRVTRRLTGLAGNPMLLWTRLSAETEEALLDMQSQIPEAVVAPALVQDGP